MNPRCGGTRTRFAGTFSARDARCLDSSHGNHKGHYHRRWGAKHSPASGIRVPARRMTGPWLEAGDRDGAVMSFMQEIGMMPPHELEILRAVPAWPARVAAAHTILREIRGSEGYVFNPGQFASCRVTTLLLGGDSPPFLKRATETVHAALPHSRIAIMPGQQHTAMNTAPELFVRAVVGFLTEDEA